MQTYHFKEMVNEEGAVTLSGLPPSTQVVIVVIQPDASDWEDRLEKLMSGLSENHPFAKMSKEAILEQLQQAREAVYDEVYGERHAG